MGTRRGKRSRSVSEGVSHAEGYTLTRLISIRLAMTRQTIKANSLSALSRPQT